MDEELKLMIARLILYSFEDCPFEGLTNAEEDIIKSKENLDRLKSWAKEVAA